MAEQTNIAWTDHTFNLWRGCTKISPGCTHCYAESQSKRNPRVLGTWGPHGTRPIATETYWREPLRWNRLATVEGRRYRVFCASMADVFENRPDLAEPRRRLFGLIRDTPCLDWLLLTKRPEIMRDTLVTHNFYPPNLWVGVSVENQEWADRRVPVLLQIPARIRFVDCEPLLGPIQLKEWIYPFYGKLPQCWPGGPVNWVIAGGESGPQARPCDLTWIQALVKQCRDAGVPVFVDQVGRRPISATHPDLSAIRHPKGGEPHEWPSELRIRQFPSSI